MKRMIWIACVGILSLQGVEGDEHDDTFSLLDQEIYTTAYLFEDDQITHDENNATPENARHDAVHSHASLGATSTQSMDDTSENALDVIEEETQQPGYLFDVQESEGSTVEFPTLDSDDAQDTFGKEPQSQMQVGSSSDRQCIHAEEGSELSIEEIINDYTAIISAAHETTESSQGDSRGQKRKRQEDQQEYSFAYETCGKAFKRKENLNIHQRTHTGEKPFTCKTCGKAFKHRSHLNTHMRTHTGEQPFTCGTCGEAFKQKNNLDRHKRTHTGERPFTCEICGEAFKRKEDLNTHEGTHTGEYPFACQTCGKAFKHKSHLNEHQRTHTGERPFGCQTCGKAFKTKSDLNEHQRTHTGERPFICETCGKAFNRKTHLNVHKKVHSEE